MTRSTAEVSRFPPGHNHARDFWRTNIIAEAQQLFGHTPAHFQDLLCRHRDTLAGSLRGLLDEVVAREEREGRSFRLHRFVRQRCEELARLRPDLRSDTAPKLSPSPQQSEGSFADF